VRPGQLCRHEPAACREDTHNHENESDLRQVAVEALASELVSLIGNDVVGPGEVTAHQNLLRQSVPPHLDSLDEELHGGVAQDGLKGLELDGESGRVADPALLGVSTRVEDAPSVLLSETGVLSERGRTVRHVETAGRGLQSVLQTGTVGGDVDLDHVDGLRELCTR